MAASQNLVLKSFSCNSLGYYLQTRFPFHCPPPSCISQNLKSFHNHGRIFITHAKKKRNSPLVREEEQQVDEDIVAELEEDDDDDDDGFDDFEDEDGEFSDDDDFDEDLYESDEGELYVGDGGGGGGISLAGSTWDKEALAIAEEVSSSLDGDLKIYAFKTLVNSTIRVRIEKLSNKSSSPTMADIEAFSSAYRARLDEAEEAGSVPKNVSLEVSSPGVERVVRIPQDLDRFKDRAMYVKYFLESVDETGGVAIEEGDGIFRLVSFDLDLAVCVWGIADVRVNREKAGKGRPLNKKQRDWRLNTPFQSLRLVRLYSDT
ncbi:uncharacterized protein LOC113289609 isoform X1 [Papaver somniferum]|uniref:uncharacterized protein LOC113289609 isoform X1 n=1 Tax=Papaver somniferum TaxID=3469 RepID=UPI000E6F5914|nr:uncharacterized protein LOC113289609 isoform X1 [Papaver somniferum]